MRPRTILWLGAILHIVSWMLPVLASWMRSSDRFLGWDAFLSAIWPFDGAGETWYQGLHYVASALSNFLLIGALMLALVARRKPPHLLRWLVASSALLNTHWILFTFSDERGALQIGYYLWLVSFFVVATGLFLDARRTQPVPRPAG